MKESLLAINNFEEPKIATGSYALGILIVRLLLLDKGSNELHPNMGVGLVKNYRYMFEEDLDKLRLEIEQQVYSYIIKTPISATLEMYDKTSLLITIRIEDQIVALNFNTENNEINLLNL